MQTDIHIKQAVIDASIAIKWFTKETDSDSAEKILRLVRSGELNIYVPELIIYEVSNALGRGKKMEQTVVLEAVDLLFSSQIQFITLHPKLAELAVELMYSHLLTFYDAVYCALALSLDIPLITADAKDHKKIKEVQVLKLSDL